MSTAIPCATTVSKRVAVPYESSGRPGQKSRTRDALVAATRALGESHPGVNQHRLAVAIRSATGIEALVWLTDIAGLSRVEAATLMQWTARALLDKAIGGGMPADAGSEPSDG